MSKNESSEPSNYTHGLFGAFLAALCAVSVQWFLHEIHWWFVIVAAVFGLYMGLRHGQSAIDTLKDILHWT